MSRLPRQYRCSSTLSSSFYWSTTCSPPLRGGEHEFTSHQTCFAAFCTATTRTSTAHDRLHENSSTASFGTTADSTNHLPETRSSGFSPTSNTSLTMSSTFSSNGGTSCTFVMSAIVSSDLFLPIAIVGWLKMPATVKRRPPLVASSWRLDRSRLTLDT